MSDPLDKALDITPIPDVKFTKIEHDPVIKTDEEVVDDIALARRNVLELIDHGQYSVGRLAELADQSQSTEAYKSLASLLKSTLDANKELVNLANAKKILLGKDATPTTVNQTLVLTTKDVLELLKQNDPKLLEDKKDDTNNSQ